MNKKQITALILNGLLVILGILGMINVIKFYGSSTFIYYTVDSNILCLLSSILFVLFFIIKKNLNDIPYWVILLRYMATISLVITFVVVVVYLAPAKLWAPNGNYFNNLEILLFKNDMLYQHLLCPIISFVSFAFFEGDRRLNRKKTIWFSLLFTFIYGLIMIILNLLSIVDGPYPFFKIYEAPLINSIVMVFILIMNYLFGRFILLLNQKSAPRRMKR